MHYEAGTLYSNSLKPVTATGRHNEHGDTIFCNEGTGGDAVVIGGQLFGASVAGQVHEQRIKARAVETAKKAMDFTLLVEAFLRDDCDSVRKPSESEVAEAMYALRGHIAEVRG